jgi:hypothetical protein
MLDTSQAKRVDAELREDELMIARCFLSNSTRRAEGLELGRAAIPAALPELVGC